MSEKYLVGTGNHIRLCDNGMMQVDVYVLWSDNTWEILYSTTWALDSPVPSLWYKENIKYNIEAAIKNTDLANDCARHTLSDYVKLIAIRKDHYKERGIFKGIVYALMGNGTWEEINRCTWADTYGFPVRYCNDDVIELSASYTVEDISYCCRDICPESFVAFKNMAMEQRKNTQS